MMYLITAGIALITAVASVFGVYNYIPLSLLQPAPQAHFGASITTINGSDTLSSSRSVINTNFANLNTSKFELSDWYATTSAEQIVKLGTITTGTWSGTAIAVAKGGTGTTSPTSNQVILGNGASGFKVVSGLGSSGQLLQSAGAGNPPAWATVTADQAANYTWTGGHLFTASSTHTATTSISASSVTNNALKLNGVPYSFPSSGIASSTYWAFDATGKATYGPVQSFGAGQTSTSTGIGNMVITHGLGATPKLVVIHAYLGDTVSGTNHTSMSGSATAASQSSTNMCVVSSGAYSVTQSSTKIINVTSGASCTGTLVYAATLSAWTSTTFTLNFTTADSNGTLMIQWEAYQ